MKKVLVPLAPGCEEMEAVTIIDVLRRGGLKVICAATQAEPVQASRGVVLVADVLLKDALTDTEMDMVAIPGGMGGTQVLLESDPFIAYVQRMSLKGCIIGAICAAPLILAKAGLLKGRKFTAYPGVIDTDEVPGSIYTGEAVVEDSGIITSRGPGTALDFALALLEKLEGHDARVTVEDQLVRS